MYLQFKCTRSELLTCRDGVVNFKHAVMFLLS